MRLYLSEINVSMRCCKSDCIIMAYKWLLKPSNSRFALVVLSSKSKLDFVSRCGWIISVNKKHQEAIRCLFYIVKPFSTCATSTEKSPIHVKQEKSCQYDSKPSFLLCEQYHSINKSICQSWVDTHYLSRKMGYPLCNTLPKITKLNRWNFFIEHNKIKSL